jgi:hypothetical protein
VVNKPWETPVAEKVARALAAPLTIIRPERHLLDLFDDPFAFDSAGFPSGRNLTSAVARQHPGVAVVNGFLGDRMIRGTMTRVGSEFFGKDEQRLSRDEFVAAAHGLYAMKTNRLDVLDHRVEKRVMQRARDCLRAVVEAAIQTGKPLAHTDLHTRHRFYLSNIFYHHLDEAEALLPFYCWELINVHTSHDIASYLPNNHELIFQRHFPALAQIPHSLHVEKTPAPLLASRHLRRWSREVLAAIVSGVLPAAHKRKMVMRLGRGLLCNPAHQTEILFLHKLLAFTQRLGTCNLRLDLSRL